MNYKIVNRPAVRADVENAVDYYKNIDMKLAQQFLFRIREARKYLADSPFSFQTKYRNVRTLLLKQFPYHIHYLVDSDNKLIIILAIIHSYKNPVDYSNR